MVRVGSDGARVLSRASELPRGMPHFWARSVPPANMATGSVALTPLYARTIRVPGIRLFATLGRFQSGYRDPLHPMGSSRDSCASTR